MDGDASRPMLRFDRAADQTAVDDLFDQTFSGEGATRLLEQLRTDGDLLFLLLAEQADAVIAAAAFSRVYIESDPGAAAAVLGPMAVRPAERGRGVGTALARAGFSLCRRRGVEAVLATGHDRFLTRLGFTAEAARSVVPPWKGPELKALMLHDDLPELAGAARYPAAFDRRRRSAA